MVLRDLNFGQIYRDEGHCPRQTERTLPLLLFGDRLNGCFLRRLLGRSLLRGFRLSYLLSDALFTERICRLFSNSHIFSWQYFVGLAPDCMELCYFGHNSTIQFRVVEIVAVRSSAQLVEMLTYTFVCCGVRRFVGLGSLGCPG